MKKSLLGILLAITLVFVSGSLGSSVAYAAHPTDNTSSPSSSSPTDAAKSQVCIGVNSQASGSSTCAPGGVDVSTVMKGVLNVLSVIAGLTAVIMIMISGLKYITSSGEAQAVSAAKRTLLYAIVGLLVVAFALFIVWFVLNTAK